MPTFLHNFCCSNQLIIFSHCHYFCYYITQKDKMQPHLIKLDEVQTNLDCYDKELKYLEEKLKRHLSRQQPHEILSLSKPEDSTN